jgi:hypothetical protein
MNTAWVKKEYSKRIRELLADIRDDVNEILKPTYSVRAKGPHDLSEDEYQWDVPIYDRNGELLATVALSIAESDQYDGGSENGINFILEVIAQGGRILGQCAPYNYTSDVWVPLTLSDGSPNYKGIEQRFCLLEYAVDRSEIIDTLEDYLEEIEKGKNVNA